MGQFDARSKSTQRPVGLRWAGRLDSSRYIPLLVLLVSLKLAAFRFAQKAGPICAEFCACACARLIGLNRFSGTHWAEPLAYSTLIPVLWVFKTSPGYVIRSEAIALFFSLANVGNANTDVLGAAFIASW